MENCKIVFTFLFLNIMSLCYADPIPDPEPDPMDLILQVSQVVKNDQCCPEPDPEPQCLFGDKAYPNKAYIEDTCMVLQCIDGVWNYIGKIHQACGDCTVHGEPHIIPFDNHTWGDPNVIGTDSNVGHPTIMDAGTYTITQHPGIGNHPEFGVNSTFIDCTNYDIMTLTASCVLSATYYEPGLVVIMTLPDAALNCSNGDDPQCAIQVSVNGQIRSIGSSVESFYGTDGTVLVFEHNHIESIYNTNCTNIVGSKGLSVSLCVVSWDYAWLYVWALPSLKEDPNILNGLCDTFTGTTRDVYIARNGSEVPFPMDWEIQKAINEWGDTWLVESENNPVKRSARAVEEYHNRVKREDNNVGRCTNTTVLLAITKQCLDATEPACKVMSEWWCLGINAACIFDLCRVANHESYALGYTSHMHVHTHLATTALCPISSCFPWPFCC